MTDMHMLPHTLVREEEAEYVVELDVSDFSERELSVQAVGPVITVRGVHKDAGEAYAAFRVQERLDETFRFPDDADLAGLAACYRHGTLELSAPRVLVPRRFVPIAHRRRLYGSDSAV